VKPLLGRIPPVVLVALGGGLGSLARVAASASLADGDTPWVAPWMATASINLIGSVLAGFVWATLASPHAALPTRRLSLSAFALAGFFGGFTTFSGFGLQTAQLAGGGRFDAAMWNLWIALIVAVGGAMLGSFLARSVREQRGNA